MLSFIGKTADEIKSIKKFKYISCYLLSFLRVAGYGGGHHLNTSHVIFYRTWQYRRYHNAGEFKYISCYLLSKVAQIDTCGHYVFKYISCYLLSGQPPDDSNS